MIHYLKHLKIAGTLVATLVVCSWTTAAHALELGQVLANTLITPPANVSFREQRHNPLLKEPMILTGYLEYMEAGFLRKVVATPFEESYLVGSGAIEIERDGEIRKLSIGKSGPLRTMLVGIEAILAGEVDNIESTFFAELSGSEDQWVLVLKPRSRRVAKYLQALQVTGDDQAVNSIRFDMKGDEWQVIEILHDVAVQ
jgi:hypothetical protein